MGHGLGRARLGDPWAPRGMLGALEGVGPLEDVDLMLVWSTRALLTSLALWQGWLSGLDRLSPSPSLGLLCMVSLAK